jgi:hypothetical protein
MKGNSNIPSKNEETPKTATPGMLRNNSRDVRK